MVDLQRWDPEIGILHTHKKKKRKKKNEILLIDLHTHNRKKKKNSNYNPNEIWISVEYFIFTPKMTWNKQFYQMKNEIASHDEPIIVANMFTFGSVDCCLEKSAVKIIQRKGYK